MTRGEREFFHPERFCQQAMLQSHIVGDADRRELRAEAMTRRGRGAVARQVHHDDEIACRIDRHSIADQILAVEVGAAEVRRDKHGVVARGIQFTERDIGDACISQGRPGIEHDIAGGVDLAFLWIHNGLSGGVLASVRTHP